MSNPLVAPVQDSTKAYSGISLVESAESLKQGIESGDWASIAMGAVGTALDALTIAMDPFGAILAAGVGWLLEHVGPLKEALNALTGDADQIAANSETWKNIAAELSSVGNDLASMVAADTTSWVGDAGDAYRQRSADTASLLQAASKGCEGAASGVKTAGEVVGAVRMLVRDTIAQLVGHLISWALQVVFTLGIGLAWVVPEVIAAVAKTASEIANVTGRLVKAIKALIPLLKKAGTLFEDAGKALKKIKPGEGVPKSTHGPVESGPKAMEPPPKGGSTTPSGIKDGPPVKTEDMPPPPKGDDAPPPKTDDSTTPSGAGDAPPPPKVEDAPPVKSDEPPPPAKSEEPPAPPVKAEDPPPVTKSDESTHGSGAAEQPPRETAVPEKNRFCETDPVDIASGDVVMSQTDLTVTGTPTLELVRTHISSYRAGGWFGPSWASTVDFRLEVRETGVRCLTPDGMILFYPVPVGAEQVLPVEGPRWPLRRDDVGFVVTAAGQEISFAPIAGRSSAVLPVHTVSDGFGSGFTFDYDEGGAPAAVRHTDGYLVSVTTAGGRVTALDMVDPATGARVPVAKFSYDAGGRLTAVSNSSELAQRFDYDGDGRMTGWQDRTGSWYRYVYDADGRCVRTVGDRGFYDGVFSYDRERLVTRFADSLGAVTEYQLNEANQTVRRIDPAGGVVGYEWDRYDALLSRTDPLGAVTRYRYAPDGTLTGVTRPDGSEVLVSSAPGSLSIAVTEAGRMYDRTYSGGRLPDPFAEQLGVAAEFSYEDLQKPNPFTEAESSEEPESTRHDERDLFGRLRTVTDAMGGRTQLSWTVEGLRAQRIDPLGAREHWGYDAEGHAITHTGADGAVTRREYGPFGLVTATTDALGARTGYRYDTELRLVEVSGPHGASWRYAYDAAGRLVEETDYDGRTLTFSYDAAGRVVRSVNGVGEVTEFGYDVLGNLTERRTDAGSTNYSYDPVGRLIVAATADSTLEIRRDERGRVVHEAADGRGVTYAREDGVVRRRTPSGVDSAWVFDAAGSPRRLEIAGRVVEFEHDADGRETTRRFGETTVAQTFDPARRLTGQTIVSGSTAAVVQRRQFRYRGDGRLTEVHDALAGVFRYELDPLGRVSAVSAPNQVETFRYDAIGNITHAAVNGTGLPATSPELGSRRYSGNQLVLAGSVGYGYDRQGRLIMRRFADGGVWHYHWDSRDRLTAVTLPDGSGWQYRYDPLGRRVSKEHVAGGRVLDRTEFTWRGAVLVEQTRADAVGRHVTTWEYHPVDGRPVVQWEHGPNGSRFTVVVTDLVDRPAELVDEAGTVVWKGSTSLWGRTADTTVPLGFPGQYADAETGLHYNVYRYYDPSTARYVSQDPLGLGPAMNPVAYAPNPLHEADPLGLTCTDAPSTADVPDRPGSGGGDAAHLTDDAPTGGGRPTETPDFGDLNQHNVAGPSTEHTIKLPDGTEHKIVSTPMTKLEGYHGIKPEHYDTVVNGDGVARPGGGTAGNANADWKGWYLGESHEDVAPFSWNGDGQPGAVLKYETPGPVTVHDVPHQLTAEVDGGIDPVTMGALKQHFGLGDGESLMDGLGGKGGVIRTTDGEEGMSEFIVPWDKATGGPVSVEGYVNMMNDVRPRPTRDNGLFGQI